MDAYRIEEIALVTFAECGNALTRIIERTPKGLKFRHADGSSVTVETEMVGPNARVEILRLHSDGMWAEHAQLSTPSERVFSATLKAMVLS